MRREGRREEGREGRRVDIALLLVHSPHESWQHISVGGLRSQRSLCEEARREGGREGRK